MSPAVSVHHVVEGPPDAPILVLSNSLGSTLAMWDPQMADLTRSFSVVRYDLRGHGDSPVPPDPYDIADLGGDVLALLDRLGIGRAHLCGLSLGGMVSMWLAAHAPNRVDRLVLCATSARFSPPEAWAERAAIVRAGGIEGVADIVVGRWFTPEHATTHPELIKEMRAMIAKTPPKGYEACCRVIEHTDLRPSLSAILAPTLVIAGAQDLAAPVDQAELINNGINDCRMAVVERAAHLLNVERPENVNALILEHLLNAPTKEDP
ncbi:MAG: 3-oxoadipate enol-lactonase [Actinomycetota bacterium]